MRIIALERDHVVGAADQARRLVEQALAHRPVAGEQLAVQGLELGAGVDAEAVREVAAVGLVAVQRGRHAVHGREGAQQRGDHLVVRLRPLQERQGCVVLRRGRQAESLGRSAHASTSVGASASR